MSEVSITIKEYESLSVVKYTPQIEWRENCYLLVYKNKNCLIIDPGFECEEISSFIEEQGYDLKKILLTHAHHDHLASAEYISNYFDIPCLLDHADKRLLMHAPMYGMRFAGKRVVCPHKVMWLNEVMENDLRNHYGIRIIRTPGHTSGGVCYVCENAIFSGDTIVRGYMGRSDLPGSNTGLLHQSIAHLLEKEYLYDNMDLYPGHGKVWTIGEAREWWHNGGCKEQKNFE